MSEIMGSKGSFKARPHARDAPTWLHFWNQNEFWTYPELFEVNAKLFAKRVRKIIDFKADDKVLNIGCGPGFLEAILSPQVASIASVDVVHAFVKECQRRNDSLNNVEVFEFGKDYTDVSIAGSDFSLFLCISVVQYYPNIETVERLIRSAQRIARPGAKMLIADLPQKRSMLGSMNNLFSSVSLSIQESYFTTLLGKALKERKKFFKYRQMARLADHLYLNENELKALIHRMDLTAEILKTDLSICANRLGLLIHF